MCDPPPPLPPCLLNAVLDLFDGAVCVRQMETVEISDEMVNPCGEKKLVPDDFDLLKTIGQGGYGKVGFLIHSFSSFLKSARTVIVIG